MADAREIITHYLRRSYYLHETLNVVSTDICERDADAILAALSDAGLVLVPTGPTDAQLKAAQTAWLADPLRRSSTIYRAMIKAAQEKTS